MRTRAYKAVPSASTPSRRKAVGKKWPGIYERTNAQGERALEFDYYDETGRRRWQLLPSGTTLKQAQATREKYRVQRREGTRFAPAHVPTLGEAWTTWHADASVSLRPRTVDNYRLAFTKRLVPRLGRRKVSEIDKADVLRLVRDLQRHGYRGWTIRSTLGPLSLFLQWAADQGWRTGNPVAELRRNEKPKVSRKRLTPIPAAGLWKLVQAAGEDDEALVALWSFTGVRLEESLGFVWEDFDLDGSVVTVRGQLERAVRDAEGTMIPAHRVEYAKTDAGTGREIDLTDDLVAILRRHRMRSAFKQQGDFVVCWKTGQPLDYRAAERKLDRVVRAAGMDGGQRITPHVLRYNFGSLLIEGGENIAQVSRMLGHGDVSVTLRVYVHAVERAERAKRSQESLQVFARGTNVERRGRQTRVIEKASSTASLASVDRSREG